MLKYPVLFVLLSGLVMVMSCSAFAENFPPPGTTAYSMDVTVNATIYTLEGGVPWYMDDATATCNMSHGSVQVNGEGYRYIDLNTGPFVATGTWHYPDGTNYGPATLTVSTCPGEMTSLGYPEGDFPADSFFDVFVTLNTPIGTFWNTETVHLSRESVYGMGSWSVDGGGVPLAGGGPYDMLDALHLGFDPPVPEPSSLLAMGAGLIPFGLAVRRKLRT